MTKSLVQHEELDLEMELDTLQETLLDYVIEMHADELSAQYDRWMELDPDSVSADFELKMLKLNYAERRKRFPEIDRYLEPVFLRLMESSEDI